ncbi:hypothetical protein GCM10027048_42940 [Hymenobacter coalescens]
MNHRTLGSIAFMLSPMLALMLTLYRWPPFDTGQHVAGDAAGWLFLAGWLCSAVGMRQLRVLGPGPVARGLSALQITLLVLASLQQILDATVGRLDTWYYFVCDVAWPASMAMMLVTGTVIWRAGVWTGWRRMVPLLCGLALPAAMLTKFLVGYGVAGVVFGGYSWGLWALLGLAVRAGQEAAGRPAWAYVRS